MPSAPSDPLNEHASHLPTLSRPSSSHPKPPHPTPARAPLLRGLALHLLADLEVDLEELAHAAVQAHALALVEVRLAVLGRDALGRAGLGESVLQKGRRGWLAVGNPSLLGVLGGGGFKEVG